MSGTATVYKFFIKWGHNIKSCHKPETKPFIMTIGGVQMPSYPEALSIVIAGSAL